MVASNSLFIVKLWRQTCCKFQKGQGSSDCANASGTHRLPLMLINKSQKPRCFKHMDMNNLPVHYYAQNKSWMDSRLFTEWFHNRFVPSVRIFCRCRGLEEKVLLLLDNAPSHPSSASLQSEDGKIKTLFLPPNTTSIIQPIDQGVLDLMKNATNANCWHTLSLKMNRPICLSQIFFGKSP